MKKILKIFKLYFNLLNFLLGTSIAHSLKNFFSKDNLGCKVSTFEELSRLIEVILAFELKSAMEF